jgi:hypothetical protein
VAPGRSTGNCRRPSTLNHVSARPNANLRTGKARTPASSGARSRSAAANERSRAPLLGRGRPVSRHRPHPPSAPLTVLRRPHEQEYGGIEYGGLPVSDCVCGCWPTLFSWPFAAMSPRASRSPALAFWLRTGADRAPAGYCGLTDTAAQYGMALFRRGGRYRGPRRASATFA